MTLTYRRELLRDVINDVAPLTGRHCAEVGQSDLTLSPDWGGFLQMERQGRLVMIVARDGGLVVGYAVFALQRHLHYAETVAINDAIYLAPEVRKGFAARGLIRFADTCLIESGARKIYYHVKLRHDWRALLERIGYEQQEVIMSRSIG